MNESRLVQLFDLLSSRSWETVTKSLKEAVADPLPKYLLFGW